MTGYLHTLPEGYRIQEYELVRVLGHGGFGITYLGHDHHLDKAVAIKEYLPNDLALRGDNHSVLPRSTQDTADYEWGLERFLGEAQVLARFDHRHIIKVYRFFRAQGTGYIVMEYAEGETLSKLLQRQGTLTEAGLRQILFPLLDGLEAVHQAGFLHRDITPGNVVIRDDGSPVLIDFGAARQAVAGKSRSVTAIITPGYAPIEQYSTKGHQGPWTDIYGLGAVCYRCLAGTQPDDAVERIRKDPLVPAAERCRGKVSVSLLAAIDRALCVDEGERPQTISAWRSALGGAGDAETRRPPADKDITVTKGNGESEDRAEGASETSVAKTSATNLNQWGEKALASRPARLGAVLADSLFAIMAIAPIYILGLSILDSSPQVEFMRGVITGLVVYLLMNGYFLLKRGQTLGKMLFRTRVVDAKSGEIVSFWRVFVLRWLAWQLTWLIPLINLVCLIDLLFIFNRQRRCLHDYLAGTIVIKV